MSEVTKLDNRHFQSLMVAEVSNRMGRGRTNALGSPRSGARADEVVGSSSYKCDEL